MARAHAIWVVVEEIDYEAFWVQAAFTVKHELITWLKRTPHMTDDQVIRIWKKDDGLNQKPLDYKLFWSPDIPNVFKPSDFLGE